MPKVSVIIPSYNRAHTLNRAISSVLQQSQPDFELMIIDDASMDETASLAIKWADPRVKYFRLNKNSGVSAARNFGIQQSQAEWIAFLDSDDEWLPKKLELQLQSLSSSKEIKIIHGEEIWIRNGLRVNPHKKHQKYSGYIFDKCIPLCCISPSTVMIHRSVFKQIGTFNESFPVCEDYDLWLRICAIYPVLFVKQALIKKYGGHSDQLSQQFFAMDYWRIKSLFNFINNENISPQHHQLLRQTIIKKSKILLNGYKKHNNMNNYSEVEQILLATRTSCDFKLI